MTKSLAIIPARGGSKRILGKNKKLFHDKPIIQYSIEAAKDSEIFDVVMVSTDDNDIADIARESGAQVPFVRSEKNSDDSAILADVVNEVLRQYEDVGIGYDFFCCILPTAPFVKAQDLIESFQRLSASDADGIISIVKYSFPIQRSFRLDSGYVKMAWPEHMHTHSQDLEPHYHDAGQFYFMKTSSFLEQQKLFPDKALAYELSEERVQDIDTLEDWRIAEIKFSLLK